MTRRSVLAALLAGLAVAGIVATGILLTRHSSGAQAERVALVPAARRRALPALAAATLMPPPERLALASLRGKPLVIDVWASWCTACREEAPALARLAHRSGRSSLRTPTPQGLGRRRLRRLPLLGGLARPGQPCPAGELAGDDRGELRPGELPR